MKVIINAKKLTKKPKIPLLIIKIFQIIIIELGVIAGCWGIEQISMQLDATAAANPPNMTIVIVIMPFLLFLYFFTKEESGTFFFSQNPLQQDIILVKDKKGNELKGFAMLEISDIPEGIVVRELREHKKKIERLINSKTTHYLHYHYSLLAQIITSISMEMYVQGTDIKFRISYSLRAKERYELIEGLELMKTVIIRVFQIVFPNIKISPLSGQSLYSAWEDILGGYGSYGYCFNQKLSAIEINHFKRRKFLALLQVIEPPCIIYENRRNTLIDQLIIALLGAHLDFSYVVAMEPVGICDFSRQSQVQGNLTLSETEIESQIQHLRHEEKTALWNTSIFIVVRSDRRETLPTDIQRIKDEFRRVFSTEFNLLSSRKLKAEFSRLAFRSPLHNWLSLTSEQIALLFHFPERKWNGLLRSTIPHFEVPPEYEVASGIKIGDILLDETTLYPFCLNFSDLRNPILLAGDAEMGKTNMLQNLLHKLSVAHEEINWLIIDTKGEYPRLKNVLQSEVQILDFSSFGINLFDPIRASSNEHARKLLYLFQDLFGDQFHPLFPVCESALKTVINNPLQRNIKHFLFELNDNASLIPLNTEDLLVLKDFTTLIEHLNSLEIINAPKTGPNFEVLLKKRTVLCLNRLPEEAQRLLLNLIFKHIIDEILRGSPTNNLQFLLIVDDAHLICSSLLTEVPETSFISDIPRLLPYYGSTLIAVTTHPERILDLANTSALKFIFRTTALSTLLPCTKAQARYVQKLSWREVVVSMPRFQFPFRMTTDYFNPPEK